MTTKSKRIMSLDLVRVFSCLCVLICHFNASVGVWNNGLLYPENSIIPGWYFENRLYIGDVGVSLFFMLSGASLMLTYKPQEIKKYYQRRFLGIYPLFWIVWFAAATYDFLTYKGLSGGNYMWLITTIAGMDGYLGMHGVGGAVAFYKVGEWFLGCIVLLYLFFPFIHKCINGRPLISLVGATLISLVFMNGITVFDYKINSYSFFVRIPEMMMGMLFIKYNMREKKRILLTVSMIAAGIAILTRHHIPGLLFCICMCSLLFTLLVCVGEMFSGKHIAKILSKLSELTYPIFLIHHWLSDKLAMGFDLANMSRRTSIFMFAVLVVLVLLLSELFLSVKKRVLSLINL